MVNISLGADPQQDAAARRLPRAGHIYVKTANQGV